MVYRIYAEKKAPYAVEAKALLEEMRSLLDLPELTGLRILNRYDAEGLDEALFRRCVPIVFSEPRWMTFMRRSPRGRIPFSPWSLCPDSLTSERIRRPSVCSSSAAESGRWWLLQKSIFCPGT